VPALLAQALGGTFSGKVTNAQGTAVPNAAVTVTNSTTNVQQKVLTGPDGGFTISGLAPGTYQIDVETQGYKHTTQQNVTLVAGGPTPVNITLEAGNMSDTVELRGHTPAIHTATGESFLAIDTRDAHELPVVDRNFQQLAGLQRGVTPPEPAIDAARDPDRNRFFSVNGQSAWNNQWEMDGVLNQEPFRNTAVRVPGVESVQQFNTETAAFVPMRGYIGGSVDTSITSAGTNGLHGTLFEFFNGDIVNTRNSFDTISNSTPRWVDNIVGGSVGGALVPDKTFLYGSYQGNFANGRQTELTTVPSAAVLSGNFSAIPGLTLYNPSTGTSAGANRTPFSGNVIPSNLINPTAAAIAGFFPAANLPGYYDNYVSNPLYRNHDSMVDTRLDQHFSDRTAGFLRYGYTNDWSLLDSPLGSVIGSGTTGSLIGQNAIADISHEFGPRVVSDLRMGYNRYDQHVNSLANQTSLANALGTTGAGLTGNNLIGINISGFQSIGAPAYAPEHAVDNTFNWVWAWSMHTSRHNVTWGVDIRRFRTDGFTDSLLGSQFGANGAAYFGPGVTLSPTGAALGAYSVPYNAFASFLLGQPAQVGSLNYLTTPTIRQSQYAGWVGDRIQFMRRFTLDIGLRYDAFGPLSPRNAGGAMVFNPATNTFNYAGIGGTSMNLTNWDTDALSPRAGFAARITNKTVFRAGYAMQYFQEPYMLMGFQPTAFGSVTGIQGGYTAAGLTSRFGPTVTGTTIPASLTNGMAAGNIPAAVVPQTLDTPYVQSFHGQLQQEFYWGTVLDVGYAGSLDRHLPFVQELNAGLPGTSVTSLPYYSLGRTASTPFYGNGLTSNYNALQVGLNKRFAQGVSFIASYTWSHALGYTTGNNLLQNPFNLASNYGPLDTDRRHVLTIGHIWEIPFGHHGNTIAQTLLGGWQLNGIFTWSSGTPLTLTSDPVSCACLNVTPGVTFIGQGNSGFLNSGTQILNPSSFAVSPNSLGTLGRGTFYAPGYRNYDMSLFKNFHVHDRYNVQLRGEAYNLTNSTFFAMPVANVNSPDFGQQVSTVNGAFGRQVNLALRILF
jgi:hypothetical protein